MRIDPGLVVIVGAVLAFYLRLIIGPAAGSRSADAHKGGLQAALCHKLQPVEV